MLKHLTIEDLQSLPPGSLLHVSYDHFNQGEFDLLYHSVTEDEYGRRIMASFCYTSDRNPEWVGPGDYFYEYMGVVCRGSGAEPLLWDGHTSHKSAG